MDVLGCVAGYFCCVCRSSGARIPDKVSVQSPMSVQLPPLLSGCRGGGHLDARDTPIQDVRLELFQDFYTHLRSIKPS